MMYGHALPARGTAARARVEQMMRSAAGAEHAACAFGGRKSAVPQFDRRAAGARDLPRRAVQPCPDGALFAEIDQHVAETAARQQFGDAIGDVALAEAIERQALARTKAD